jgi:hypothetical protein
MKALILSAALSIFAANVCFAADYTSAQAPDERKPVEVVDASKSNLPPSLEFLVELSRLLNEGPLTVWTMAKISKMLGQAG